MARTEKNEANALFKQKKKKKEYIVLVFRQTCINEKLPLSSACTQKLFSHLHDKYLQNDLDSTYYSFFITSELSRLRGGYLHVLVFKMLILLIWLSRIARKCIPSVYLANAIFSRNIVAMWPRHSWTKIDRRFHLPRAKPLSYS